MQQCFWVDWVTVDHLEDGLTIVRTSRGDQLEFHQRRSESDQAKGSSSEKQFKKKFAVWRLCNKNGVDGKQQFHMDKNCTYIKGKDIDKVVLEKEPPEEKRCKVCVCVC